MSEQITLTEAERTAIEARATAAEMLLENILGDDTAWWCEEGGHSWPGRAELSARIRAAFAAAQDTQP